MIETTETKTNLEVMLDKARGLRPLRQQRDKFARELQELPFNAIRLQVAGRPLIDEKKRIETEMAKVREKEQAILQEVREFFEALVKDATQPIPENISALISKRLQLRDLLAQTGAAYAEIEQVQKNWTNELNGLRRVAAQLKNETNDNGKESISFSLPEVSFPTPLVPSPSVQHVVRLRERGDNLAEILQAMAKQIG